MIAVRDVVTIILAACGGIITIGGAITVIAGWISKMKSPEKAQDERIAQLEIRLNGIEARNAVYDKELSRITETLALIMKAQFATLGHAINGNDIDTIKKVQAEMQEYLTKINKES